MPEPTPSRRVEKIRSYIVWQYKKLKEEPVKLIAFGMLVAGIALFLNLLPKVINEFLSSLSTELIFSAITILVIDQLNERRAKRLEMEELTRQMGSPNNTIAVEAIRKWKRYKDQERQDKIDQLPDEERKDFPDDEPVCLPSLRGLWLAKANLSNADLTWLDLREAYLKDAKLMEVNLAQACLRNACLDSANLCNAILVESDLTRAYLREAKLTNANLSGATLDKADLYNANLSRANLQGANFRRADLYNANLSGADLRGANFSQADLSNANLSDAKIGLPPSPGFAPPTGWRDRTSFSGATYNDKTIWPNGIDPIEYKAKKDAIN